MFRRLISSVIAAALFITMVALSPNRVLAADDCLAQPDSLAAPRGHWYYHFDRVNNRKCWYLGAPQPTTPQAEVPEVRSSPTHPAQLPFPLSLFTTSNPAATQVSANTDGRTLQANPRDELKNPSLQSKQLRTTTQSYPTAALALTQQRQSPIRQNGEQASKPTALPLTETERVTLFKNFLNWKKDHLSVTP